MNKVFKTIFLTLLIATPLITTSSYAKCHICNKCNKCHKCGKSANNNAKQQNNQTNQNKQKNQNQPRKKLTKQDEKVIVGGLGLLLFLAALA